MTALTSGVVRHAAVQLLKRQSVDRGLLRVRDRPVGRPARFASTDRFGNRTLGNSARDRPRSVAGSRISFANSGIACFERLRQTMSRPPAVFQSAADALQPRGEKRIPLLVGPDSERFEIPAVVAIVLQGQVGPQFGGLRRTDCAATRSRIRGAPAATGSFTNCSDIRQHVGTAHARRRCPQCRDADIEIRIAQAPFRCASRHVLRSCSAATVPARDSAGCRIDTALPVPARLSAPAACKRVHAI